MPPTNAKVSIELYVDDKGTLRVKQFAKDSKEAFRQTEEAGTGAASKISSAWDAAKGLWGWIAVGATAAVTALSAMIVSSAREAKEMESLARLAKMGADEFRGYSYATESVGIAADKLADISKDVQDKLGDFIATGGGEFADFFEKVAPKVGLTAEALQKLSGPDVLIAVKQAMDDANVSAEEQVFYLEAIGDDASRLIPLLENGGKAMKDQAARAKELGVALSEIDNRNLAEAGGATSELSAAFGGLKNAVAAEFAPIFTDVMQSATELIIDVRDEARALAGTFVNIGESFKGFKAVFDGRLSFFEFATMDAKELDQWLAKNQASATKMAEESGKAQGRYQKQIQGATNAIKEQEKQQQKILDKQKSEAEQQAAAEREMYEEAGLGADKYFSAEATELVQKAQRWKKAGADVIQVEQWLYDQLGQLSEQAWAKGESTAGQAMDDLRGMSETLTDQFSNANASVAATLEEMGFKIDELDGTEIGISARFDGSAVVSGIEDLVTKFQQLRAAAAAAAAAPTPSGPAPGSYQNTDSSKSAAEVAAEQEAYYAGNAGGVTVNINQQLSRSDVTSIISEQARQEARK
jgi:hypothetical protein